MSHHDSINPFDWSRRQIYPLTQRRKKPQVQDMSPKFNSRHHKNTTTNSKLNFKSLSFLKHSSVYALSQVGYSSKTWRKIFWLSIFLFGIIGFISQVSQFLVAYRKYPVVNNIDYIRKSYQEFPAVTVCNLNSIRKAVMPDLENRLKKEFVAVPENTDAESIPENYDDSFCSELHLNYNEMPRENLLKELIASLDVEKRIALGHQRENFIKSCKFNKLRCSNVNYTLTVSKTYGNCYTFNYVQGENNLNTFVCSDCGLELELDIEVDEYMRYTDSVGARVQIHNPYLVNDIDVEGFNLRPGTKTFIGVSKEVHIRRPPPYKDLCRQYDANDSMRLCYQRWLNGVIVSACSCSFSDIAQEIRNCDIFNRTEVCCYLKAFTNMISSCDCPLSCHEVLYKYQISHTEWPSKAYYDDNQFISSNTDGSIRNMSFEEVRKTRLILKVSFDTLEEMVYQQNPLYQSSEILSQIGGQMGLWLGLSLMVIFELFESLILLFQHKLKKKIVTEK